jgi:hypothetical protein
MENQQNQCKDCRFFLPMFHAIGKCKRQYSANSKIWQSDPDKGDVMVHISFGCVQFEKQTDPKEESI